MDKYLLNDSEKKKKKLDDTYKEYILEYKKNDKINLLEYEYLVNFINEDGTVVNSDWFVSILKRLDDDDFTDLIIDIFNFFTKSDSNSLEIHEEKMKKKMTKSRKKHIKFTKDQKNTIKKVLNFLPNIEKGTFGLFGYAGTGKTTTIVEIVVFLLKNKYIKSIAFTAPTNKAVNVMKYRFKNYIEELHREFFKDEPKEEKINGFDDMIKKFHDDGVDIEFTTIHKLLKFEMDYDKHGDRHFVKKQDGMMNKYELIVIDECSMLPIELINHIFTEIRKIKSKSCDNYKKVSKVIFCGDPAQLPPIKEQTSVIFGSKYHQGKKTNTKIMKLLKDIDEMETTTLKKVMRSKLDSVTNICYEVRLWTIGEKNVPDMKKYINNGVEAYKYNGEDKTKTKWFKKCIKYHKKGKERSIILTWTNKQCDEYNKTIRETLFSNKNINTYEVGDILIINEFYNIDEGKSDYDENNKDKDKDKRFYTSEQLNVSSVNLKIKKISSFSQVSQKVKNLSNGKSYEKICKKTIDTINTIDRKYKCWELDVKKSSIYENKHDDDQNIIFVIHEDDRDKLKNNVEFVSECIKSLRKTLISKFPEKKLTIDNNIIKPLWREWHKNTMEPFANVNYGYSVTCHKAQGSNFYNVFVDIDDITKNNNENETKKCLYTAMTRASNELHLLLK
jgi:hypothetical protein